MLRDLVSLLFPNTCINCRQSLLSEEKYLCTSCKVDLPITNDHLNPQNDLYQKFAFDSKIKSASAFLYFQKGGVAQKLLYEIKYRGKSDLAIVIGRWYAELIGSLDADIILPVPLHNTKLKKRTFNQSEKIVEGMNSFFQLEIKTNVLQRTKITATQTKKNKMERWKNMNNVFSDPNEDLNGKSVLVVDDVITTGATIGMLCERLSEANVSDIHLLSIARGR